MADVTITVRPNGPYRVEGPIDIIGPDGQPVAIEEGRTAVSLCRCGQSAEKPFCDGTHKTCGFAPDVAIA